MTDPIIISQNPPPGVIGVPQELVDIVLTLGGNPTGFKISDTVISQYANSPRLGQLIQNMAGYFDPTQNLENFYNYVWNLDSAVGFGLDVWGRIIDASRILQIPTVQTTFGFNDGTNPSDYQPFGQAPFYDGPSATNSFSLSDEAYRTLLYVKAFGNICSTTIPALNQMLQTLFSGRGRCYVQDLGNMEMSYTFEFALTPVEYAILNQAGVPPRPAGVQVFIFQLDLATTFGFAGSGLQPFGQGVLYNGA